MPQKRRHHADIRSESKKRERLIRHFFLNEPITRASSDSKDVYHINGTPVPKRLLQVTLQRAYVLFKSQHPEFKFGYTVFRKYKPREVVQIKERHTAMCVCSKHANVQFKYDALRKYFLADKPMPGCLTSLEALCDSTLCDQSNIKCVWCNCENCGPYQFGKQLGELLSPERENTVIKVEVWERHEAEGTTKYQLLSKREKVSEVIDSLEKDLHDFVRHKYTAHHQHKVMNTVVNNLPPRHAASVMDFAENFTCTPDSEIQSAHWTTTQVTIPPMMFYFRQNNGNICKISVLGISDDLLHDTVAVTEFTKSALSKIKSFDDLQEVDILTQFTDGCAAQYK